jgi:hypothetical protein
MTNILETDWRIKVLGFIPIVSPHYATATARLSEIGEVAFGKSEAISKVILQHILRILSSSLFQEIRSVRMWWFQGHTHRYIDSAVKDSNKLHTMNLNH